MDLTPLSLLPQLLVHSARDGGKEKPIVIAKPGKKALKVQRVQIWLPKDSISAGLSGNSVRDKDNVLDVTSNGSVSPKVAERACSIVSIGCVQKAEPVALAPQGGSFPQRPLRRRVDSDTIPVELQIARRRTGTISAENVERLLNPPSSNHREHAQEDAVDNKESLFFVAEKTSSRLWDIPASSTKSFSSSRKNDEFARNFVVEPSFPSIRSISLPVDARKRAAEMDPHISIVKTCPPSPEVIAPTMSAPAPAPLQQTAPRPANSLSRTNADLFLETDLPVSRLQVTIPSVARVNVGPSFLSSDSAASMSPRLQNRMIGEPELQALTCTSTASTVTGFNITSGNTEMDATFRQHVRGDDYFMRLKSISSERTEPGHLQSPHRQKAASATKRAPATVEGNTSVSRTLQELIVPSAPASHRPSPQRQFIHQHSRHHQQQQQQHNQNQPQRSNAVAITQRGVPMRAQAQLSSFPATQPSPFQHSRLIGRHSTVESASTIPKRTSVSDSLSGTQTTATKGGLFEQQNDFFELLQGSNDISASFELNIPIPEDVTALNGKEVRTPVRWGRPGGAQEGSSDSPERPLDAASAAAIDAAKRSADRTLLPHVLTPASALETYMHLLTHAEQSEILHFPRVYFLGHSAALKVRSGGHPEVNGGYDYKDGLYITQPGDHLRFRYEILSTLGKGSFGQVYRCRDHKLGVDVAVKVIKNLPIFNDQAAKELFTLKKLLPSSPDVPDFADLNNSLKQQQQQAYSPKSVADTRHHHFMVQLVDSFEFRAHKCFVFPVFGKNLYEHMRDRDFAALPMSFVKSTARQLLSALVHLKSLNILHCDIKPENVLIRDEGAAAVVLIDFGSSCLSSEATFTYIQSRFYRSPEVLLGLPYGE